MLFTFLKAFRIGITHSKKKLISWLSDSEAALSDREEISNIHSLLCNTSKVFKSIQYKKFYDGNVDDHYVTTEVDRCRSTSESLQL